MLDNNDFSHYGSATRNRTASMDFTGHLPMSKRGRSGSISGRLRAASDLEEIGWIDKSQKGVIKDLIISGDSTLRCALDKYENGDAHDLEVLIQKGMLARKQSLDLLDGLDMDFLTVGYGADQMGGGGSLAIEDDFFMDQNFEDRGGSGILEQDSGSSVDQEQDLEGYSQEMFRHRRSSSISLGNSLIGGDGSFDLAGGNFFDGLGSYFLPQSSSRRHSLSMPPALTTPRSGFIAGLGTGGDVDMSAYQSMAASLQAQSIAQGHRTMAGRAPTNAPLRSASIAVPSSSSAKSRDSNGSAVNTGARSSQVQAGSKRTVPAAKVGEEKSRNGNTTSALPPPQMQNRMGDGGHGLYSSGPSPASDTQSQQRQHQQQMDRDIYSQQQQQHLQQQRQQQLAEMQHSLMLRQLQINSARQQQQPIMSHPHGHIHASNSHAHYAPQFPQSGFYSPPGYQQSQQKNFSAQQNKALLSQQHMFPIAEEVGGLSLGPLSGLSSSRGNQPDLVPFKLECSHYSAGMGVAAGGIISALSLYNPDGNLSDAPALPLGGRGYVGAYSPEARRARIERFLAKRDKRVWTKKVKYDVRKNFADSRLRVKGRFVKKEDEELMKELLSI